MSNIETLAFISKKPKITKVEAQRIIKRLFDENNPDYDLINLYKFFKPSLPKKPKSALEWIYKAVHKGVDRYYLKAAFRDHNNIVATDGHRMHIISTDYEDNTYYIDVNGTKLDLDKERYNFPKWETLVPKCTNNKVCNPRDLKIVEVNGNFYYVLPHTNEYGFNVKYIDDALLYSESKEFTIEYSDDFSSAIIINVCKDVKAVIMPYRFK